MPNFHYQAFDAEQKLVSGELQAESVQKAIAQLEAQGLTLQSIGVAFETAAPTALVEDLDRITTDQQPVKIGVAEEVLRSHMVRVLERGVAIAPALQAFAQEMPSGKRRRQLLTVVGVLQRGDADEATAALTKLPEYWIPLLSAATTARDPARVLREFLDESQAADDLRRQRWRLWTYPALILGVAAVVMTALSIFIIPIFREMFEEFDLQLPMLTFFILDVGYWISSGRIMIALAIVLAIGLLMFLVRQLLPSDVGWLGDRFSLPFGRTTAIARIARFTADLIEGGLETPDALRVAGFTSHRGPLRRAAWQFADQIEQDGKQQSALKWRSLTASLQHALEADVSRATRIHLLREISQCHADRSRFRLSWTRGIVEPITIAVVGIFVGFTVIALFLPLVKLIDGLAG